MARKAKLTDLGKFVAKLRIDKDIRVITLAKAIGISNTYIYNIESGKYAPSSKYIEGIIKYFKLSGDDKDTFSNLAIVLRPISISHLSTRDKILVTNLINNINLLPEEVKLELASKLQK